MIKIKNRVLKVLQILFVSLILCGCSRVAQYVNIHRAYGIIKDGKIDRMQIPRDDLNRMNRIIREEYGIMFNTNYRIYALYSIQKAHYIKFYDDIILTIKDEKYTIPKEHIKESLGRLNEGPEYSYANDVSVDIKDPKFNDLILNLGEIEIVDKDGEIVRPRRKIPPILFKKVYFKVRHTGTFGFKYDLLYWGWAEDYQED